MNTLRWLNPTTIRTLPACTALSTALTLTLLSLGACEIRGQTSPDPTIWSDWQSADAVALVTIIDTVAVSLPPAATPWFETEVVFATVVDSMISGTSPSSIDIGIRYQPETPPHLSYDQQYLMSLWNCDGVWRILPGRYWAATSDSVTVPRIGTFALSAIIDSVRVVRAMCTLDAQNTTSEAVIRGTLLEVDERPSPSAPGFYHMNTATLTVAVASVPKNTTTATFAIGEPTTIDVPFRLGARPWFYVDHEYMLFVTRDASGWTLGPTPFAGWEIVGSSVYVARVTSCRDSNSPGGQSTSLATFTSIVTQ